ncbi:uncharacterized protein IL334_001200 [Kwoniella shivajii]|uniref:Deoxyuridine 5'-triphosphate nucleotidohydrolase n=1 Tax=Kwoniella shivajii TaxID=564305 RepID=A0ABZ1CR88_9TREE|nr:hypothetical protein IL334_001200 [Kwoniella shivajii]
MSAGEPPTDLAVLLDVQLLSERGTLPTHGSTFAAGLDLYSAESKVVPARGKALVDIQIAIAVPNGHYARIAPRSGLASKHSIQTGAGVIDADYRGPVMVLLFNHADIDFEGNPVKQKDRIAQLILERISIPRLRQVESLDATVRGAGGFGSTGGFGSSAKRKKTDEETI